MAWTDQDSVRQTYQDESGRLQDVLWMARIGACQHSGHGRTIPGNEMTFRVLRVPRGGRRTKPQVQELRLHVGPGEPVATIFLPGED